MDIITVEKRNSALKAKQLRRLDIIPCVICGSELQGSIPIQIEKSIVNKLFKNKREGSKIQLKLDDKVFFVQIKDKTQELFKNEITHIGFQILNNDEIVNSVTHIILQNTDKVTGSLEKMLLEIPYSSLPDDMIDTITINLDGLPMGTIITVGDISEFKNKKIELQVDTDSMILRLSEKKGPTQQEEREILN